MMMLISMLMLTMMVVVVVVTVMSVKGSSRCSRKTEKIMAAVVRSLPWDGRVLWVQVSPETSGTRRP